MWLIDADKLLQQVKAIHAAVDTSEVNAAYDTGFHSATSQIQGLIEYMPTISTESIRLSGRLVQRVLTGKHGSATCSECNTTWDYQTSYCPNCGAKME